MVVKDVVVACTNSRIEVCNFCVISSVYGSELISILTIPFTIAIMGAFKPDRTVLIIEVSECETNMTP